MGNVLSPYSFNLQGGYPQGTIPETYGTVQVAPEGFYVSNTIGSDSNDGLSPASPFLTIQKATEVASTPGDIVNIMAGTYQETSLTPGYGDPGLSVAVLYSGTVESPIIFRAHFGDEGLAIIDGQNINIGFSFNNKDYIHLLNMKFINSRVVGIHNWNSANRYFSDNTDADYAKGILVQGNHISGTDGSFGSNIASIRIDSTVDAVVRNNYCGTVTEDAVVTDHTSSLQAYKLKNMLVENNDLVGGSNGVLWKDHWLEDDKSAIFESEIRYNLIKSTIIGVSAGAQGTTDEPPGSNYIHHNIIEAGVNAYVGTGAFVSDKTLKSGYLTVENNVAVISNLGSAGKAVVFDIGTNYTSTGNIILGYSNAVLVAREYDRPEADLMQVANTNYNIYDDSVAFRATLRANNASVVDFNTLSSWQAVTAASQPQVSANNPDANTIESTSALLFTDAAGGDYTLKVGSPAIDFMPDNSDAGAYQYGTEIIGRTGGGAT